ncbi:hypothetical protein FACS1894191_7380 [Clostridia bacterium]|nr:hypothetical protein FACS1894191_7380 [Clostridia bacterium]
MKERKRLVGRITSSIKANLKKLSKIQKIIGITIFLVLAAGVTVFVINKLNQPPETPSASATITDIYTERMPEIKKQVENNPDDPSAHDEYATALRATGDYEKAKEQYEKLTELTPSDPTVYNNLGNTLRDLGDYEKAKENYQKSIDLNPKQINPYINLASLQEYQLNNPKEALETYKKSLLAIPEDQTLTLQLALTHEKLGNLKEARELFEKLLEKTPDNISAQKAIERLNAKN